MQTPSPPSNPLIVSGHGDARPLVYDPAREGYDAALHLEWLETDGLGGFSSSTLALAHTRRYHAWFAPAVRPPLDRRVLWAASEEFLETEAGTLPLSSHHYVGTVHPEGHRRLLRFEPRPFPRWVYAVGTSTLERCLFLVHGQGDLFVSYTWRGPRPVRLRLVPCFAFRDYHRLGRTGTEPLRTKRIDDDTLELGFEASGPSVYLTAPGATFIERPDTYKDFVFPVETYRGLDDREDLSAPGEWVLELKPGVTVWLRAGLGRELPGSFEAMRQKELERREALALPFLEAVPELEPLALAADQFLVRREDRTTVIAGYPWFTDWGRDTMIALPGLTLATGRPQIARELILTFAAHLKDGLIPNRFPDEGETPEYNTVDATLWMSVALFDTWLATRDRNLLEEMVPLLTDIRSHHVTGTRHGIHVDDDGLVAAGEPGVQLTWMDAKVDDWVVTPRTGKPVEIQALWYNFLMIGDTLSREIGVTDAGWRDLSRAAHETFETRFWDENRGYLADLIDENGGVDGSLRPNQLFALSLPHALIEGARARSVLSHVRAKLLTPRGLRSLSPDHRDYHPRYGGNRKTRDAAYHQGTVWGWLHGPYMEAVLRFEGSSGREEVRRLLAGWAAHLHEGCLGQIAEVFDGETPFASRGCPAQAWSVAEVLRMARVMAVRATQSRPGS